MTTLTAEYNPATVGEKLDITLQLMKELIEKYKVHPFIRRAAAKIIKDNNSRDHINEANSLFLFVRDNIKFVQDINGVETLQSPVETIEIGIGDCDCKTILLNTLLECIGFQTRFACISDMPGGKPLNHIYSQFNYLGNWIGCDPVNNVPMGAEPANFTGKVFYEYE